MRKSWVQVPFSAPRKYRKHWVCGTYFYVLIIFDSSMIAVCKAYFIITELITWQYTITGYAKTVALHFLADLEHGTALNADDYDRMSCQGSAGVILRHADLAVLIFVKTAVQHILLQAVNKNTAKNAVRKWQRKLMLSNHLNTIIKIKTKSILKDMKKEKKKGKGPV